jgi:CRISPR-associated protein Csb2
LCESPPEPTWRPAEDGELPEATLRVPSPGRLASLRGAYDLSLRANRRIEPPEGAFRGYVLAAHHRQPDVVRGVFDERLIVFQRMTGPALPLHASLKLTSTVRKALMDLADEPVPEVLSGHAPIGGRSDQPHVAAIPLPNVGSRYSTGLLTGFALVLPTALFAAERREERVAVLKAIGRLQRVRLDSGRIWQIERVTAESTYRALQPTRYTQASRRWASITPVVFGCFPKSLESKEAKEMVCQHCGMIGLPEPQRVEIMNVSPIFGVPPASHFPTLSTAGKPVDILFEKGRNRLPKMPQKQAQPRVRAHVLVEFRESVFGPILLGAGRYLGMGLCLPVPQLRVMRSEP